ncbi:family 3 glycosyl hydrolase [Pseudoclavibacter sp. RFBJ3]|nr:family 3 glycosyl hydrolase [Pseudoclavibacter sp. RFBJ5]PPF90424.1 family 3 glycosyl hydrolase [Pseudoclavibacter sp. RFBJ3]PPG01146.1 family 3 glycosyl hydrolase [Pseudoclavibacter sp. RFBH5]PPG26245.1 family 3 glycosyl hydrolase [Pseudoclavibacter sp. RFBI4]
MNRHAQETPSAGQLDELIEERLRLLSLESKIRLLSGADSFSLHGDESIGLRPVVLSDGPTGVRGEVVVGGRESCLLPNASLLAQTWSRAALAEAGGVLADEAEAQHTHVVLGPTINLHRSPLGGRLFEAFSEDPLLTGHLASAYISALQERGIGASAKHFLGNESETERTTVDVRISDKALREVYLTPFEIAVQDSNPWTLMAAYNNVNGVASTEHHQLLTEVVKDQWGYDGLVMSDWYATKTAAESANAGLDLVMPGPETPWTAELEREVRSGVVAEATIDEHVRRLLRLAWRVGALDSGRDWLTGMNAPTSPSRRAQLMRLAARGMVVLKNERQTLPLSPDTSIALIGRHASDTIGQGGGSAQVRAPHIVSVVDGLTSRLGADRMTFTDGVETRQVLPAASTSLVCDPETGEPGVRARALNTAGEVLESRHLEVAELEDSQIGWLEQAASIQLSARLTITHGRTMQIGARGPGNWRLEVGAHRRDLRIDYHPGPGGGFFRPKSSSSPVHVEPGQLITATVERDELPRILGLVVNEATRSPASAIAAAATAARNADVAVVVVGLTPDQETEGEDKASLSLPGEQDALVAAVASVATRTVVVVNAATPVLMPWLRDVDAVLFTGLPGQEAGDAVAAALLGDVLPEGRLVTTFPGPHQHGPAWNTTPRRGILEYAEGTSIGYRGWFDRGEEPAFWFGHGLGLTTWHYSRAVVARSNVEGVLEVEVDIANTGCCAGQETVQVYFEPDRPDEPVRLIGWGQASIGAGESITVRVVCDPRLQRSWDTENQTWVPLQDGVFLIGRSLGDVRVRI